MFLFVWLLQNYYKSDGILSAKALTTKYLRQYKTRAFLDLKKWGHFKKKENSCLWKNKVKKKAMRSGQ